MQERNHYNNNPLLKRVGSRASYTPDQVQEMMKCMDDPIYFITKYCKIVSLDSEEPIPFELFGYQDNFLTKVHNNRRVISMQPRQSGKTQTIAAYICWYIVFQRNQTVAILANKADAAREILSRCKFMYEYLPTWMQHGIKKWNEGSIALENGSKAFTAATSKSGLRGRSCVTGDTKVCISNGINIYHAEISSLEGCKGLKVLTEKGFKKFETVVYQGLNDILKLTFDDGTSIKATHDHRFWSNRGWVRCDDVKLNDNLSGKIVKTIEGAGCDDVYDMYEVEETHSYYSNGVISHNCNFLYIDEAAAIPNNIADDFFTAIYPIVSAGTKTKIIITSTPIGYNHFWSYWNEAEKGKNGFIPVRVNYWEHPKRDDKWAAEQKQLLGEVKYNQEVMCQFLGSSATLINGDTLSRLSAKDYIWSKNEFDAIEEPQPTHTYFLSVDTSEGVGGDYSTFHIIDVTKFPYLTVGKYRCNTISYLLFPNIIYQYAKRYNEAFVLIEINGIGNQVAHILYEDLEYENVLMVSSKTKDGQFLSMAAQANYGVKTTKQVKRIGCQALKALMEEQKLLVFDGDTIKELSTFIERKGSYSADEGYHDDLVMPLVTFAWASQDNMFKDIINVDTRKAIFESRMYEIENEMLPVGFYNDGTEEEETFSFF